MYQQMALFADPKEDRLEREVENLRAQLERNRKSLHAKNGELMKLYLEQKRELEILKSAICRYGKDIFNGGVDYEYIV